MPQRHASSYTRGAAYDHVLMHLSIPPFATLAGLWSCAACLLTAGIVPDAAAQAYPQRPIRIIVPFTPGGGSDMLGRLSAQKLTEGFMQQSVVENRAGAGGRMGAEYVAKSPADGYTLLLTGSGSIMMAPALYRTVPYETSRDFAPITLVSSSALVLITHPSVPVKTVRDLIALSGTRPGQLNFSTAGSGSPGHLAGELFQSMAKTRLAHVAYRGTAPGVLSVVMGETDLMFSNMLSVASALQSARLRALAVTSLQRSAAYAHLPTIAESGLPGFEVVTYYGLLAPAGTPPDIVERINSVLTRSWRSADIRKRLEADGSEPVTSTPPEFAALIRSETDKWTRIIKNAGIAPQ